MAETIVRDYLERVRATGACSSRVLGMTVLVLTSLGFFRVALLPESARELIGPGTVGAIYQSLAREATLLSVAGLLVGVALIGLQPCPRPALRPDSGSSDPEQPSRSMMQRLMPRPGHDQ